MIYTITSVILIGLFYFTHTDTILAVGLCEVFHLNITGAGFLFLLLMVGVVFDLLDHLRHVLILRR